MIFFLELSVLNNPSFFYENIKLFILRILLKNLSIIPPTNKYYYFFDTSILIQANKLVYDILKQIEIVSNCKYFIPGIVTFEINQIDTNIPKLYHPNT